MQDWVSAYTKLSKESLDEVQKVNLDSQIPEKNRTKLRTISGALAAEFNCKFDEDFGIRFALTLADLAKEKFDSLCRLKNVFYVQVPDRVAGVRGIHLSEDLSLRVNQGIKVVMFSSDLLFWPYLACKGIIIHELIHIICSLGGSDKDEECVHNIAKGWGFGIETELAIKHQREIDKKEQ